MRVPEISARSWDELVLAEHERELLGALTRRVRARERRPAEPDPAQPLSQEPVGPVLFAGPPGTGKTVAAEIIAADLGLPLQELDLAAQSSQQTVKLQKIAARAFEVAEKAGAVLVIDGAGPLLEPPRVEGPATSWMWKRQTAPAPVPSVAREREARERLRSYILDRSDRYDGLVIFTATVARGLDPAADRRFHMVINFPFPDADLRKQIWRRWLPQDAQLTDGTLDYLSSWLRWSGGAIHRCCLAAADAAALEGVPVQLRHVAGVLDPMRHGARDAPADAAPLPTRSRSNAPPPAGEVVRVKVGRGLRLIALSGLVAAAIVGLILAGTAPGSPSTRSPRQTIQLKSLRVSLPARWRRERAPQISSLGLTGEQLAVAPPAPALGTLIIANTAAGSASVLPPRLLATATAAAAPQIVKLAGLAFYRYLVPASPGHAGSESIYAIPTTTGTIVGVCRMPGRASAALMSGCERVLSTLELTTGRALPVTLSQAYAQTLNSVVTQLNAARSAAGSRLAGASSAKAQAAAAAQLAGAYAHAGSAVSRLHAGIASVANAALAHALLKIANAYTALANAAAHHDARAYSAARAELLPASRSLSLAFTQLKGLGYRVV